MSSRQRGVGIVVLAALLAGCSVGSTQTGVNAPYYIGLRSVTVDTDYIHRYACAPGVPMTCKRTGLLSSTADCTCPHF